MATEAIIFWGWSMVVRWMWGRLLLGMLSKPRREMSSGIRMFSSSAAYMMPKALVSVAAKMAE